MTVACEDAELAGAEHWRCGSAGDAGRHTALITMGWVAELIAERMADIRPLHRAAGTVFWPTERGRRDLDGASQRSSRRLSPRRVWILPLHVRNRRPHIGEAVSKIPANV
jgi:hypothetical protein